MNTEAVFNAAHTAAIRLLESGAYIPPDSTVCALETASGAIFTGISRNEMNGHISLPVHAEVDAINNMLASGERVVSAILLINTQNRMPMLPCNHCIGYIISLDQRNGECCVIMPDRMIRLTEIGMYTAPVPPQPAVSPQMYRNNYHAGSAQPVTPAQSPLFTPDVVSSEANKVSENSDGAMLKNRVNSLLGVADDDDEEDEEKNEKPKKGLFGRFRK